MKKRRLRKNNIERWYNISCFLNYIPSHIYTRSALITRMIIASSLIFLLRIMLESTYKWKKNHDKKGKRIISIMTEKEGSYQIL
jgi:hypothetical protein